jgi:hypothetical protein
MSKLSTKQSNAVLDSSIVQGGSRVYNKDVYNKLRTGIIRENKQNVLDYIFGLNDVDEETPCIKELSTLRKEYKDKLIPITDNGIYIYTEKEIKKYGVPAGNYVIQ